MSVIWNFVLVVLRRFPLLRGWEREWKNQFILPMNSDDSTKSEFWVTFMRNLSMSVWFWAIKSISVSLLGDCWRFNLFKTI